MEHSFQKYNTVKNCRLPSNPVRQQTTTIFQGKANTADIKEHLLTPLFCLQNAVPAADMRKFKFRWIFPEILLYLICCYCQVSKDFVAFETGNENKLRVGQVVSEKRYLIYDVNPGEGFNLRRDVYMRVANLVKILNEKSNWTLVVPPWRHLYHWKTHDIPQNAIPWRTFFDMKSLNRYAPVIEFEDFVNVTGSPGIDETLYLQRYKEGWRNGEWEEKIDERKCIDPPVYKQDESGVYRGYFWGLDGVFSEKFRCMSVQGLANILVPLLTKSTARLVKSTTILLSTISCFKVDFLSLG